MAFRFIIMLAIGVICGCSTQQAHRGDDSGITTKWPSAPLACGEKIRVEVTFTEPTGIQPPQPMLDASAGIDAKGDLKVLGGSVHVAGLTPAQAAEKIKDYYEFKQREWGHGTKVQVSVSRF
jgi:hypothetical protein